MNEQALVKTDSNAIVEFSAFGNISHFENAQRMAKALASSSIVPAGYQGEGNIGSCVIALEIANRIGASVLAVMQNLYVVHGKPGWSSQFLISCVNASKKFTPLRYKMTGTKDTDSWGCIAWAQDKTGEILEAPEITIGMAKSEGWYAKNGSKWKTMPELMLRYRTATLFARLYAPELTMGIQTADEIQDVIEVQATASPVFNTTESATTPAFEPAKPAPKKTKTKPEAAPMVEAATVTILPGPGVVDESTPTAVSSSTPTPAAEPAAESPEPTPAQPSPEMLALIDAMKQHEVSKAQLVAFCVRRNLMRENADTTGELELFSIRPDKIVPLTKNILAAGVTLGQIKGV